MLTVIIAGPAPFILIQDAIVVRVLNVVLVFRLTNTKVFATPKLGLKGNFFVVMGEALLAAGTVTMPRAPIEVGRSLLCNSTEHPDAAF